MELTDQQREAVYSDDGSVVVSAAAGSGKTSVLTERLIRLITDPELNIRADRIIAVTFTNDAANELKNRVDSRLRQEIIEDPSNDYLLEQQALLRNACISTINSFCFDILRENIGSQGITAGFSVIDEAQEKILKKQALDETIEYFCAHDKEKMSYIYDRLCMNYSYRLEKIIMDTDRFIDSLPNREKWLDEAEKEYEKKPEESKIYKVFQKIALQKIERAKKLCEECRSLKRKIILKKDSVSEKNFDKSYGEEMENEVDGKGKIDRLDEVFGKSLREGKIPDADNDEIENILNFNKFPSLSPKDPEVKKAKENYKKNRDEYKDCITSAVNLFKGFEDDFNDCREVTSILSVIMKKYYELLWEKKCARNALSFSDGERLVLDLLSTTDDDGNTVPSETAKDISKRFDIIMIDEYQDTNKREDMIFRMLSDGNRTEDGIIKYGGNAFIVGDIKQCIYEFRYANPRNFADTVDEAKKDSDNHPIKYIALNRNFRSSRNVVDTVNMIFRQLMSENCGGADYDESQELKYGASKYDGHDDICRTQINLINKSDITGKNGTGGSSDSNMEETGDQFEQEYTARLIKKMIDEEYPVVDGNGGSTRPCRPGDFCILLRSAKNLSGGFVRELKKLGVNARGEDEQGYLDSQEIMILIDLLKVIDNPRQDIPLATVLMSPMFPFSFGDIVRMRIIYKRKKHKNENSRNNESEPWLYTLIKDIADGNNNEREDDVDDVLIKKCADFLEKHKELRLYSATLTVSELISRIYDTTDFTSVMRQYSDGEQKRANLRALITYAKEYESSVSVDCSAGLSGFLRFIDRIKEGKNDFNKGRSSESTGDYVSVKTIHKSKGLEYPFIILAKTEKHKGGGDGEQNVVCSADGGIGYVLCDPENVRRYKTKAYSFIKQESNEREIGEGMRLLYVALTRASQKLFINIGYKEKKETDSGSKKEKSYLEEAYGIVQNGGDLRDNSEEPKSFKDWILASLINHECFSEIAETIGFDFVTGDPIPSAEKGPDIEICCASRESGDSEKVQTKPVEKADPDPELYNELKNIIGFEYDMTYSQLPASISVTSLLNKTNDSKQKYKQVLKRPLFVQGDAAKLTGAERGTAIHTFFQYCDFEKAAADLEGEIEKTVEKGYLTKVQADSIDRDNAAAFLKSPLYERIKNSGCVMREEKFIVSQKEIAEKVDGLPEGFKNSDGTIKGIADLIYRDSEGLVIVDYKSSSRKDVSEDYLRSKYSRQLELYKAAMEIAKGEKVVKLFIYSFELKKEIEIKV